VLAGASFVGGTEQVRRLQGRKVRTRTALHAANVYDPISNKSATAHVGANSIGIIANPHPTQNALLIAFPTNPSTPISTLDDMMKRGNFTVIVVNQPTFRQQFEIEI